jgi:hypothetical protein
MVNALSCVEQEKTTMTRIPSLATSVVAAMVLTAALPVPGRAQATTVHKLTFLTFSAPVQIPGATLPAGKYAFQLADPASDTVWQVFDAHRRHLIAQFFYVPTGNRSIPEINAADGKPVVRFHETPQGTPPALRVLFYPSDRTGNLFVYPRAQAEQIAAVTHQPVLATDNDALAGGVPTIVTIGAETADAANNP